MLGHRCWQTPGRAGGSATRCVPLEEKESDRWLLGYDMACALQTLNPDTGGECGGPEGDIYGGFWPVNSMSGFGSGQLSDPGPHDRRVAQSANRSSGRR